MIRSDSVKSLGEKAMAEYLYIKRQKQSRIYKEIKYYSLHLEGDIKKNTIHILVHCVSLFSDFYFNCKKTVMMSSNLQ